MELLADVRLLQRALVGLGAKNSDVLMPGYPVIDAADHDEAVRADILRVIAAHVEECRTRSGRTAGTVRACHEVAG